MNSINYNEKGYSRALYFAFTLKGVYHPDMYIAEKLAIDEEDDLVPTSEVRASRKPRKDRHTQKADAKAREERARKIAGYRKTRLDRKDSPECWYWQKTIPGTDVTYSYVTYDRDIRPHGKILRQDGKSICRNWAEDTREFIPDEDLIWEEEQIARYNENGHWDVESQSFVWNKSQEPVNADDWEDTPSYFISVRRWNEELHDHIIERIPNPEYAYMYLLNKGLRDDFISWLKAKETK